MANYSELIATINDQIKANGNQEITGPVLNSVLQAMVSALGEGYQFMGVATPATNPGTPDGKVFYLAFQSGSYVNFGGAVLKDGFLGVLVYSGSWTLTSSAIDTGLYNTDNYNVIPSAGRKGKAALMLENTSTLKQLARFIGNGASDWSNLDNWVILRNLRQAKFIKGVAEYTPIKNESGEFIEGTEWEFRVLKEIVMEGHTFRYPTLNNLNFTARIDANLFVIPEGVYPIDKTKIQNGLWFDTISKKVIAYPTSFETCVLLFPIKENYDNYSGLTNVDNGILGNLLIYVYNNSYGIYKFTRLVRNQYDGGRSCYSSEAINVDDFIYDYENQDLYDIFSAFWPSVKTFHLGAHTYKTSGLVFAQYYDFEVLGVSKQSTILKGWDFSESTSKIIDSGNTVGFLTFKNLEFNDYFIGATANTDIKGRLILDSVVMKNTTNASSKYMILCRNCTEISIRNSEIINGYSSAILYNGIRATDDVDSVIIDNCKFYGVNDDYGFYSAIYLAGIQNVKINGCIIKSKSNTGILIGGTKVDVLKNITISNNYIENITEEAISFDSFGNNVSLTPIIAELSINNGENIGGVTNNVNLLKLYCEARVITGTQPNAIYESYTFAGNENYLEKMYVVFSQRAGEKFEGVLSKIIEVGSDDSGQYLIISSNLNFNELTLSEDRDIESTDGNYRVASIVSGFHNGVIDNNEITNTSTALALYMNCFSFVVTNNKLRNCRNAYLYCGEMLAKPTYEYSNSNIISNNIFENIIFTFEKYGDINGYYNALVGNIFINAILEIKREKKLLLSNNNFIRSSVVVDEETTTQQYGESLPDAAVKGDIFYDETAQVMKFYNGTEWVNM